MRTQPLRFPSTFLLFLLLGFCTQTQAQPVSNPAQSLERCGEALESFDVRSTVASFGSVAVRNAMCSCLLSQQLRPGAEIEPVVRQCLSTTSPHEKALELGAAALARVESSLRAPSEPGFFVQATLQKDGCVLPKYPEPSEKVGVEGSSKVAVFINRLGRVADGSIISSSGRTRAHKLLDVTALFSLMQCSYSAALVRGKPVDSWTEVTYEWRLE